MVFSSVPFYLDPPNWQQQADHQAGSSSENPQLPPPPPPEGGGGGGSIRPGSMADRARLAKLPQPDAPQKCPRCDSNNTKFCYFNNYSLSQPRHFCKTCRRYWTRGGALRSVPVGGGCRRNKRSKASSSKSQASVEHHQTSTGSTSAIPSNSYTNDIRGPIPALSPPPPQLPFMASLQHLSDYGPMDIGLNYGGILPSLAATGVGVGGRDMDYQMGSNSGSGGTILSAGGNEQWRLQQVHQFPFLTGLEPPPGLYPFEGEGVGSPSYAGGAAQLRGKSSGSSVTQLASVKMEDSRGLNLSRQFLGIPGNDQYWGGGNAWTDLSGFNS